MVEAKRQAEEEKVVSETKLQTLEEQLKKINEEISQFKGADDERQGKSYFTFSFGLLALMYAKSYQEKPAYSFYFPFYFWTDNLIRFNLADNPNSDLTEAVEKRKTRGDTELGNVVPTQNFACVFGCAPSIGVDAETKMVQDVCDAFLKKFDREQLTCDFPEIFQDLQGTDTNFELVTSATLQTLRLFYKDNFITKSLAVIFENSKLERKNATALEYKDCEKRAEIARGLYTDVLRFDEVEVCKNYSK